MKRVPASIRTIVSTSFPTGPAAMLAAIGVLASCQSAPPSQASDQPAQPQVTFTAADALPTIGAALPDTSNDAQPDASRLLATPPGAVFNEGLALTDYEKQVLGLRRSRAEKQSAESQAEAMTTESPGAALARPQVIWQTITPPPASGPAAYPGPDGLANDPPAVLDASASVQKPLAQGAASATPPVLKLADLIPPFKSQLAMQAADSNSPLREYLVAASLLMLDGERRTDPAKLHDLTDREREVLKSYQDYFSRLGQALRTGGGVDAVVSESKAVAAALSTESQLKIPEFRLCSRIVNYGLFDEIKTYKFPAMRPTPLLTYVEIEGFKSVPGGDGQYVTRVRHELELFSESDGEMVYSWPAAPAEDTCGKVRRDFFLPRQIQLPSNLTVGRYRLKVRIIDEQSQQQAESVIALSIVAGGDVAIGK